MYDSNHYYLFHAGGEEYGCEVDPDLWLYYSINVKKSPPPFYDPHFYTMCNDICKARYGIDLNNGVTHTNWSDIYKFLRNNVL